MNDDERQERIALIKARHRREVGYDYDEAGRRLEGDPECHFDEQDWPCDTAWLLSELDAATARAERAERAYLDIVAGDAKRFHFEDCARNPDNPPNHSRDECVGGAVDMARAALAEGA